VKKLCAAVTASFRGGKRKKEKKITNATMTSGARKKRLIMPERIYAEEPTKTLRTTHRILYNALA
jgi:hypothetical protein